MYHCAGRLMSVAMVRTLYVLWGSLGRSLLAGGGSLFHPCLRAFSPCGAQSPALFLCSRRPRSDVCANALRIAARSRCSGLPVRSPRCSLAAFLSSRLRRTACAIPSPRGSRSSAVALAPPRSPPLAVRRAPIMYRLIIAVGHAQSACETMRNVPIIV